MPSEETSSSATKLAGASEAVPPPSPAVESPEAVTAPADGADVNLLDSMGTLTSIAQGEVVQGRVLKVTESEVLVDVGVKCEAAVPREEFLTDDGQLKVAPGDAVDVWIEHYDEMAGTVSVSHRKAARRRAWEEIDRASQGQTILQGRVVERIKGGLAVDLTGVRAFLPGSHADLRPHCNLDALLGQEITCKVIKLNKKRSNVVVSRKLALEEETTRRKAELRERLKEGAELVGRVKNLTDYGVFVDLGGMDGLLHITDLSWGRAGHPSEVVQIGQEIRVKVLKYDPEKERVSLGLKQLLPDPWARVASTYHFGDRVTGKVVSITDYGAFVELEPGIEGLIHVSEMAWSKRPKHPSKIVSVGDQVEVGVLEVQLARRRISLSLKQTLPDPWKELVERYPVGSTVTGQVRNLTEFGAFVEVLEGVEGLVHLSNLSWDRNVKHPSEVLKKGQKVDVQILSVDLANRRLALGFKQLRPNLWEKFFASVRVEDVVRGRVSRIVPFGAFVELREGIEGLCHISEFGEDVADGPAQLEVGSEHDFRVIRLNPAEKKIGLSLREVRRSAPAEARPPKEPEGASAMAEALSSAGVILSESTAPAASPEPERAPAISEGTSRSR